MDSTIALILNIVTACINVVALFLNIRETKSRAKNTEAQTEEIYQALSKKAAEENLALFTQIQAERKQFENELREKIEAKTKEHASAIIRINADMATKDKKDGEDRTFLQDSLSAERTRSIAKEKEADRYREAFVENITKSADTEVKLTLLQQQLDSANAKLKQHSNLIGEIEKKTGGLPERSALQQQNKG